MYNLYNDNYTWQLRIYQAALYKYITFCNLHNVLTSQELDETKESASLSRNADNTIETASLTRKLKLAKFDKEKLETQIEKASAELHATNQELKQVREEKENLVRMIYLFEETQTQLQTLTKANEKVEVKLRTFEAKWEEMPHVQAFAVCHPSETDVIEATENLFESGVSSLQETNCINEYGAVNGETDENTYTEEKVQVDLIRETVRKNRRIFELIQVCKHFLHMHTCCTHYAWRVLHILRVYVENCTPE